MGLHFDMVELINIRLLKECVRNRNYLAPELKRFGNTVTVKSVIMCNPGRQPAFLNMESTGLWKNAVIITRIGVLEDKSCPLLS